MLIRGPVKLAEFLNLMDGFLSPADKNLLTLGSYTSKHHPRRNIPKLAGMTVNQWIQKAADLLARQRVADKKAADHAAEMAEYLRKLYENPPDEDNIVKPRKRRKKKAKRGQDGPRNQMQWIAQAATVLTMRRIASGERIDFTTAYNTSVYELRQGIFNPDHWIDCDLQTTDHFLSVPTITADTKERSYEYPDPDNIRTLATYGNGTPAEGPPRYSGNSVEGYFHDTQLVWRRLTFDYQNRFQPGAVEPTFIVFDGIVEAYADRRGSAPMLSFIAKTWSVQRYSSRLETVEPPTEKSWSFYWRFQLPDNPPPYYVSHQIRRAIRTMRQPKHEEFDGELQAAVVLVAPRPMYGRGFNNNVTVTTQFDPTIMIKQIRLPDNDEPKNRVSWGGATVFDLRNSPDVQDIIVIYGGAFRFQGQAATIAESYEMLRAGNGYPYPAGYMGGGGSYEDFQNGYFFSNLPSSFQAQADTGEIVTLNTWVGDHGYQMQHWPGTEEARFCYCTFLYMVGSRQVTIYPGIVPLESLPVDPATVTIGPFNFEYA